MKLLIQRDQPDEQGEPANQEEAKQSEDLEDLETAVLTKQSELVSELAQDEAPTAADGESEPAEGRTNDTNTNADSSEALPKVTSEQGDSAGPAVAAVAIPSDKSVEEKRTAIQTEIEESDTGIENLKNIMKDVEIIKYSQVPPKTPKVKRTKSTKGTKDDVIQLNSDQKAQPQKKGLKSKSIPVLNARDQDKKTRKELMSAGNIGAQNGRTANDTKALLVATSGKEKEKKPRIAKDRASTTTLIKSKTEDETAKEDDVKANEADAAESKANDEDASEVKATEENAVEAKTALEAPGAPVDETKAVTVVFPSTDKKAVEKKQTTSDAKSKGGVTKEGVVKREKTKSKTKGPLAMESEDTVIASKKSKRTSRKGESSDEVDQQAKLVENENNELNNSSEMNVLSKSQTFSIRKAESLTELADKKSDCEEQEGSKPSVSKKKKSASTNTEEAAAAEHAVIAEKTDFQTEEASAEVEVRLVEKMATK